MAKNYSSSSLVRISFLFQGFQDKTYWYRGRYTPGTIGQTTPWVG